MPAARPETREKARALRRQGWAVKRIAREIEAAVSSVSLWVRDIPLTPEQQQKLQYRPPEMQRAAAEASKKRASRGKQLAIQEARYEWDILKDSLTFQFGIALYIAEGRKGCDGSVALANTDPRVLRATQVFYRLIGIKDSDLRVYVQVPEGGHPSEKVVAYWSSELGLVASQFNKVATVPRRKKGNKYPHGTCTIRISNIQIKRKINVWMDLALEPYST